MLKRSSYLSTMRALYRRQARLRGIAWSLRREEFDALVTSACRYCGEPPSPRYFNVWSPERKRSERRESKEELNGIDRVDNLLGYTPANCVPARKLCNRLKMDTPLIVLLEHIAKILKRCA